MAITEKPPAVTNMAGPAYAKVARDLVAGRKWLLWMFYAAIGVLILSITESFAKPATADLTSTGTWSTAVAYSVPIMLAGLGGLFAERAGIINIGLEGMLILGTWFGAWGALEFGPWWGLLIGVLGGGGGGLLHAIATVTFGIDHIISGVAINVMAPGITRYLSSEIFSGKPGGGPTLSPSVDSVSDFDFPLIAGGFGGPDILGRIESWDWFFVSGIAGILHGITSNLSWATLLAYALIPIAVWLLWRTAFGLRIRSCGEHPVAADSLGINVYRYKYYAVIISGMLAGYGGAFLVIQLTGIYRQGQTGGRGFIGLATMIFGNWKPVGTALGALLFGVMDTLQLRDRAAVHALLLSLAMGLGVFLIFMLYRRSWSPKKRIFAASGALVAALIFYLWYQFSDSVPVELPVVIPHFSVLLVLIFAAGRLRGPAADGMRYRRGQSE